MFRKIFTLLHRLKMAVYAPVYFHFKDYDDKT